MFKFIKSLFSEHHPDKFPAPETPKPKVIPYGQGITSTTITTVSGTNTYAYGSENKILPKRDSKGRFSK
jgi:hypothetical protein